MNTNNNRRTALQLLVYLFFGWKAHLYIRMQLQTMAECNLQNIQINRVKLIIPDLLMQDELKILTLAFQVHKLKLCCNRLLYKGEHVTFFLEGFAEPYKS